LAAQIPGRNLSLLHPINAVVDALAHLGVKHIDIPITPEKVWRILREKGATE
jgi:carbon-monoxide dehydrogenase large subunit